MHGDGEHLPGAVRLTVEPGERARLVLAGEVDARMRVDLEHAAGRAQRHGVPIEVDLRAVTFMDSSGIAFLAHLAHRSTAPVRAVRPSPAVLFLLEVAGVEDLVEPPHPG